MVQNFPFSGFLNYDDPDEVIPVIHNRDARNVVWKGTAPNLRAENVPGTREKVNPFLINDGNNLTIGRYYDPISKRIFTFNYRGDARKGIYMYDTLLATWYRLVEQTINADSDVLGFTQTPIIDIDIIYGDSTQGHILYFIDSLGVPKKLNIQRALSGGYGTIKKSYLNVIKAPFDIPPVCIYEIDPANTVNNLRKKLFKIKVRAAFDDQDKAVTSSQGEMPLPFNAFDQATDSDPKYNCRIAIVYQTGPANVKKVEILAAVSLGNTFSDFFLVASLDKSVEGLIDNDLGTYLFYNDKAYNYIDVEESNQLFDNVPQTAGAQTLLNGNVASYGQIKEGYPNLTNFTFGGNTSVITQAQDPYYYGDTFSRLVANQDGKSGFGSGNIHIVVRGIIITAFALDTYTIYMTDGTTITYILGAGDDAAAIIEGLRVNAISKAYTIVSVSNNDLVVFKSGISLARTFIVSTYVNNSVSNSSFYAYDWLSKHGWALVYFDQDGRTNGAVYTNGFSVSASPYTEGTPPTDKPTFDVSIYHIPPDWAYYFQWVRTKDLKKSKFQQWVSDRTYKDLIAIVGQIKYAYISIESLNVFISDNPGTPLGYAFSPGDRVTFFKRYNDAGGTAYLYYDTKDFEIVSSLVNPIVNGIVREGQFIKIILPPTDGSFDFGDGFNNYFIEMYTPAQSVANGLNVDFEYGERYAIGNPTLSSRFHQGMLQNQVVGSLPATYEFTKGDNYIKLRAIQVGNIYRYSIISGGVTKDTMIIGMTFNGSTFTDANITAQSCPYVPLTGSFNPASDSRWFLKAINKTTFRVKGTITLSFTSASDGDIWKIYLQNIYNDFYTLAGPFDASGTGPYSFVIDRTFTLENDRVFIIAASMNSTERTLNFSTSDLTFTIDHVISQRCIDANFSDYFPSAINSNGRAFIYDENANQVTFPTMYRWSLAYQSDTNINQANRFYPQNFDNVDRRFGAIMRMKTWDRLLTFFQERKCGQTGVYQKFISDGDGSTQLITTNSIITDNNIQYYAGDYGVANQADSIVQSGFVYYFVDPIKGVICRLSRDGITVLSEVYKIQTYAGQRLPQYLIARNYTFGGVARITGTFNVRKDNTGEYLCVLQPWSLSGENFAGETMAFDEGRNHFTNPYDFSPEHIVCAENTLYSFRNGRMYIHDVTTGNGMNKFYGIYYDPTITRVFNAALIEKKSFISLTEVASTIWDCPEITTNNMSYGSTPQQSNLITQDFANEESNFSVSFKQDQNSIGGIENGETLKGNLIKIKFRCPNATSLVTLSAINLSFIDSPFTNR